MRKLFKILAAALVLLSLFAVGASADYHYGETGIYDNASLLSFSDRDAIERSLREASAKTNVNYILITSNNRDDIGYYFDSTKNIIALNVMYSGGVYYYDLYTYGSAYHEITDSEVDKILDADEVYDNLKGGNIREGVCAFSSLSAAAYNGELKEPLWLTILVCAIIATVIAAIPTAAIVYEYKKKLKSPSYPLEKYANLRLDGHSDMFIGSFVTKTRVASSSSRSGGGGGRRGGR